MRRFVALAVALALTLGTFGCSKPKPEDNPKFNPESKADPMKAFPGGSSKLDTKSVPPSTGK